MAFGENRQAQATAQAAAGRVVRQNAPQWEADFSSASPTMLKTLAMLQKAAATEATVLLTGESGTGKGVLARTLHRFSKRHDSPFVVVNCPSLSAELLESELFGHRRGAFTGAVSNNSGRVSQADRGTLFLDEIGDVPLELQPKLLRFIQDRQFERIGDPSTCTADVRLVAATNHDLKTMVAEGRFRDDLYYRLDVVTIDLPPLRQRTEDIVPLAERYAAHFAAIHGKPVSLFTDPAIKALKAYLWPGNIRELRNLVERLVVLGDGELITRASLGLKHKHDSDRLVSVGGQVTLKDLERFHIEAVLNRSDTFEAAARTLGVHPSTLWRKRKQH